MSNPELYQAAYEGRTEDVRRLIEQGVDLNERGWGGKTALIMAAEQGHTKIVELLVVNCADVTVKSTIGDTAEFLATREGHHESADILKRASSKPRKAASSESSGSTFTDVGGRTNPRDELIRAARAHERVAEILSGDYTTGDDLRIRLPRVAAVMREIPGQEALVQACEADALRYDYDVREALQFRDSIVRSSREQSQFLRKAASQVGKRWWQFWK